MKKSKNNFHSSLNNCKIVNSMSRFLVAFLCLGSQIWMQCQSMKFTAQKASAVKNIILFDGVCNFCNSWVNLVIKLDKNKTFKFAPLQSSVGKDILSHLGRNEDDISSVVLVQTLEQVYLKSDVPLQVLKILGFDSNLVNILSQVFPIRLRDYVYDLVADNRYNIMGKRKECRCNDPKFSDRFVTTI